MKLTFETWLEEQAKPPEAEVAFAESVLCYKMGAYRAALLFSYVGWNLILRARLLAASCPAGIVAGQWAQLHSDLRKDEDWDSATFDTTQKAKTPYFQVSTQIREQVKYWKDRRNDCAHFKENEIVAAHVESFWAFVRSNLAKFAPIGSRDALKTKFVSHFDPNLTAPDADLAPLVREIPLAVEQKDHRTFINDLFDSLPSSILSGVSRFAPALAAGLLEHGSPSISKEAVRYLEANPALIIETARLNPKSLQAFAGSPQVIRSIWRTSLFAHGRQDLGLFSAMLAMGLIPHADVPSAIAHVVPKLNNDLQDPAYRTVLEGAGFFYELANHAFGSSLAVNQFGWGNRNPELIAWIVRELPLDDAWVRSLCGVFISQPFPNAARDNLAAMFAAEPSKRQEFIATATHLGLTPPPELVGSSP